MPSRTAQAEQITTRILHVRFCCMTILFCILRGEHACQRRHAASGRDSSRAKRRCGVHKHTSKSTTTPKGTKNTSVKAENVKTWQRKTSRIMQRACTQVTAVTHNDKHGEPNVPKGGKHAHAMLTYWGSLQLVACHDFFISSPGTLLCFATLRMPTTHTRHMKTPWQPWNTQMVVVRN